MEDELSWAPGSIDTILAGGELKRLVVEVRRETPNLDPATLHRSPSRPSTEELLLELRRRIIPPLDRRQNTWDDGDGPDSRGDPPGCPRFAR